MRPRQTKLRLALILLLLAAFGVAVAAWAIFEARSQRAETAQALAVQARALASTLGPSLAAAAAASRELDELLAWRLLDHTHLLGRLHQAGDLSPDGLAEIVDQHDLDSAVIMDGRGRVVLQAGSEVVAEALEQVREAASGQIDDMVLGWTTEMEIDHLAVASAIPGGGAVLVRIHASAGRTFNRQLGVENLLTRLAGSEEVLYLRFREEPGGIRHEVAWDGGAVPPPAEDDAEIRTVRGRPVFEVDMPVASPAGSTAYLQVGLDGSPLLRATASATRRTVLIGIVLMVFSLSLAAVGIVARWRALEREEAARRLAEAEAATRRSERLAAAGALTAGLAHEVRSPLNAIVVAAQRIERKHPPESECASFAGTIHSEVRRLDTVLRQFLDLARPVSDQREITDLVKLVDEVRSLLSAEAEQAGVSLAPVRGSGAAPVDPGSIRRALINLIHNAMEASPAGRSIDFVLQEEDGGVAIHILDRGSGLDEAAGDKLFDAFVTTRSEGTGLGLSQVRRVADEHGGRCRLVNREGGGAEAVLWLPGKERGGSSP